MLKFFVGDCLELMQAMPDNAVDFVFTSPPYEGQRKYGELNFDLRGEKWVTWMVPRVVEMCRVCKGLVMVVASGPVRDASYSPTLEWLVTDLTRQHGVVCGPAPYAWTKTGIPGSGGKRHHRRDWEPVYAFCRPEKRKSYWTDNLANGRPPKYPPGGAFSNRKSNGQRVGVAPNGTVAGDITGTRPYTPPKLANAGNVLHTKVGGGHLGDRQAHENEAPFPEALVAPFVRCYCPPDGIVLDPFCGSGTVGAVAQQTGRGAWLIDMRESQIDLAKRRCQVAGN